jgi:2',3'-cyclic-nucleotide 2'-phosphodiesterase (5'-nucleotidase family)
MILSSLQLGAFAETHLIEEGEVLWKIAQEYGLDYDLLAMYNDIEDPNMIYAGSVLEIPGDNLKKVTILGTSDLHGRIYAYEYAIDSVDKDAGLAKIQTLVKQVRAEEENVLLMDMGDTLQDNSAELFNDQPVHPMVEAMNYMGYDVWTIGNHEFNFEKSFITKNIAAFEGAVLSANIYNEGTTERFVKGYEIFEVDGIRVAVIGMIPPHVPIWEASAPSHFEGLEFKDVTIETGKAIQELEGQYDVLIGAYHLGPDAYKGMPGIEDIANAYPEFDVIFGAHAHSKYIKEVNGVQLIEPGKYGWALGRADLYLTEDSSGVEVIKVETMNMETYGVEEDPDMLAMFKYVHDASIADAQTVVGVVSEDYVKNVDYITGEATVTTMPTTQIVDTALIDLINDVQMFYADSQISSAAAFKNDMNLVAGDFMKKDVANIYKYPNTLVGVNISGAELKEYMEWSASYYNTYMYGDVTISFNENIRGYNYDMFAGVDYAIDLSMPAGERIVDLTINGDPIEDATEYKLAVNNYRFGTLMSLGLATDEDKYYDSYEEMQDAGRIRDLIIKYIQEEKAGIAEPTVDNNWKIINADLNHPLKDEVMEMIINGDLSIPRSFDGRTPNVKSINVYELIQEGIIEDAHELTILHTNDMHGFFNYGKYDGMGMALMTTKVKQMRELSDNTLLLDGGDALQGANLVTLTKGEEGTKVMNEIGYDFMAVGNHEFDYGQEQLLKLDTLLEYPMLAANIKKEDGSNLMTPYAIKEMDGYTVGLFGLTTPETTWKSHPKNSVGLTFQDPKLAAEEMVTLLKNQVDIIIVLAHLGDEGEFTAASVAKAVDGIDVMIDGHSHSKYSQGLLVGNTLIVQAEEKTKNLGIARLAIRNGEVVGRQAYLFEKEDAVRLTPDSDMEAVIASIEAVNAPVENEVVATSPKEMTGEREVVRAQEAELGNLIAESMLYETGADIAFTNGGGIRSSMPEGEVTKGNVLEILPFGNTVTVLELTGADILAALEHGLEDVPVTKGAFPHIAGMTVEFDSSKEAGSRVSKVMINGLVLDESMTYTMATSDYLASPGDGYDMFGGKKVVAEYETQDAVLIDYLNEVGFEKAVIDGRMKDLSSEISLFIMNMAA